MKINDVFNDTGFISRAAIFNDTYYKHDSICNKKTKLSQLRYNINIFNRFPTMSTFNIMIKNWQIQSLFLVGIGRCQVLHWVEGETDLKI
jgi:hypothetical protein